MLVQRDFLLRQIAQLTEAIARAAMGGGAEDDGTNDDVDEDAISGSIGLDLDLALHLPQIPDPRQSVLVGLALTRRAQRAIAEQDFDRAAQMALAAERFLEDGLARQPDLNEPAIAEALEALKAM